MNGKHLEVDQFPEFEWEPDKKQDIQNWHKFHEDFMKNRTPTNTSFNPRPNLIDILEPFVNKRGVRRDPFKGDGHEVKLTQLDQLPGYAKLVYRNIDKRVGEIVDVYINSRETMKSDIEKVSKQLYKKSKKVNL